MRYRKRVTPRRLLALLCLAAATLSAAEPGARRLKKDVGYLASDKLKGRGLGTPELEQAADYIAQRMWHLGLQPGTSAGYFQKVPAEASVLKKTDLTFEAGSTKLTLAGESVRALAARPVTLSGAGIIKVDRQSARQLKPDDVKGKVLIATAFLGRGIPSTAALTIVASPSDAGMFAKMPSVLDAKGTTAPRYRHGFATLQAEGTRSPTGMLLTGDEAFSKWVAALPVGPVADAKVTGSVEAQDREFNLRNVIGILPGSDPQLRDTCILVSAHYDHLGEASSGTDRILNGANDDASGVATMLAVARLLTTSKEKPKRSIVFAAWTGEEVGGLGSRFYRQFPVCAIEKTLAMINLEQTGRYDGEGGSGKNRALVTGWGYSDVGKILTEAAQPLGVEIYAGPDEFFGRSDNLFLAQAGVPAHTVASSLEFPDYHKPTDSAEKLDYDHMALLSKAVTAGVAAIANSATEPKWSETVPGAAPYRKARPAR
ncbi:MAG: M20/M25/M40 family metallo-hydrolase [Bryobacteraceae bacterium]|nr:M20/M25/M40 family metallo-hydrolase [Bryobacteraceae bacterium]